MSRQQEQTEFYSPFAHIPGRFEWCRIHAPSHGSFDSFIYIHSTTDQPVTVYVNCQQGEQFMADRYPESQCIRVKPEQLTINSSQDGSLLTGYLSANEGPVRSALMTFHTKIISDLCTSNYGSDQFKVWGSQWVCQGIDLERKATVNGFVHTEADNINFQEETAILTFGSHGTIRKKNH